MTGIVALTCSVVAILAMQIVLHISGYYYSEEAAERERRHRVEPHETPYTLYRLSSQSKEDII